MEITKNDINEVPELVRLLNKIDNIDVEYLNKISDEIFQKQPFFLTVLLGYRLDITPIELEEIMKIYFLIWEYFRTNKTAQSIKITEEYFETIQEKNIAMLQYSAGGLDEAEKMNIHASDLDHLKSKALYTAVLFRFNERPVLIKMNERIKGIILIGIKTFIECFEKIST